MNFKIYRTSFENVIYVIVTDKRKTYDFVFTTFPHFVKYHTLYDSKYMQEVTLFEFLCDERIQKFLNRECPSYIKESKTIRCLRELFINQKENKYV